MQAGGHIILSKEYIFYYLKYSKDTLLDLGKGGAQSNISLTVLNAFPFPLPPLNEQKRIVEKLNTILSRVKSAKARLEKIPAILKKFRQSVLAAACSGRLTEDWREGKDLPPIVLPTKKEIADPDSIFAETSGFELPNNWQYYKFTELGELKSGGTPSKGNSKFWDGELPWVSAKDMKTDYLCDSIDKITKLAIEKTNVKLIPIHSLLFVVRGMILIHTLPLAVTKCNLAINQDLKALIPDKNLLVNYLLFYFKSQANFILQKEKEASHGTRRIEMSTLQNWAVACPPLEEQHEIVRRVEKLFAVADSLEAKYKKATARVEKIEQSILAKAFRGELVEPDPNDEPAEELLKRIMEEKAKLESEKKSKLTKKRPINNNATTKRAKK